MEREAEVTSGRGRVARSEVCSARAAKSSTGAIASRALEREHEPLQSGVGVRCIASVRRFPKLARSAAEGESIARKRPSASSAMHGIPDAARREGMDVR